jgi:malate dehydrogenase (oxaloacetate-decarboxylating)
MADFDRVSRDGLIRRPEVARQAEFRGGRRDRRPPSNQINNVLAFPGVFRGALDVRARDITGMKFAAGEAIATVVAPDTGRVHRPERLQRSRPRVAAAVAEAAERDGVARRLREPAVAQR